MNKPKIEAKALELAYFSNTVARATALLGLWVLLYLIGLQYLGLPQDLAVIFIIIFGWGLILALGSLIIAIALGLVSGATGKIWEVLLE